jgi:virulence-associated protein VapD
MISMFKIDLANFMAVWKKYTQKKFRCKKIKESQLPKFFRELGLKGDQNTSLGFSTEFYSEAELKKNILKMGIKSDQGSVYFNELLYRCMRRRYGNMKINKQMQIFELRTQYKIYQLTLKEKNIDVNKINNEDIFNNIIKKENNMNPFLTIMNFKITFRTWLKFARKRLRAELRHQAHKEAYKLGSEACLVDEESEDDDEQNTKPYAVEIEIEQFYSATSEEESELDQERSQLGQLTMKGKSWTSGSQLGGSHGGSEGLKQSVLRGSMRKKTQHDHWRLLEKKLTQKFKQQDSAKQQRDSEKD